MAEAPGPSERTSWRRWLALLFLASLALRLLYLQGWLPLLEARQTPIAGDAAAYYQAAVHLAGGEGVGPVTPKQLNLISARGPGYPLFLAGTIRLLGNDPWNVRYLQAGLGAIACVLISWLAAELAGRRAGVVAGGLAALYPTFILFTGRILTETLATLLVSLGLLGLVRGMRLRAPRWLVVAGLSLALAALTRATLLSLLPFLALAAVVMTKGMPLRARASSLAWLLVPLALPMLIWTIVASGFPRGPVAGATGLRVILAVMTTATLPRFRGWRTDDISLGDLELAKHAMPWGPVLEESWWYPVAAALNLVFYHLWFLDNLWREVPMWLHALQRLILVLALGGLGLCLRRWREFSPLTLCLVPLAIVSVKWIEIRPNLPFLPILLVLGGVFVAGVMERVKGRSALQRLSLAAVCGAVLAALGPFDASLLARLLPALDGESVGRIADALVVLLALCAGGAVVALMTGAGERPRWAWAAGIVPALIFCALFSSYASVGSEPRWRAWSLDLGLQEQPVTQTIELGAPLDAQEIESAMWLVDLATDGDPPLRVALDGRWLAPDDVRWERLFCTRGGITLTNRTHCRVYRNLISGFTGALPASPQWWGLRVDPQSLDGRSIVSLTLAAAPEARSAASVARLGGSHACTRPGDCYGPSPGALSSGASTSLYRWHVANDWRLWARTRLDSVGTTSRLGELSGPPTGSAGDSAGSARSRLLAERMSRGEAHASVRLLVKERGGASKIY